MNPAIQKFLGTSKEWAPLIIRVTLGLVILPHGLQKTLGIFGGYGFEGTIGFFTGTMGLPWLVAFLVILGESLGALSLILGFMTRFSAASMILIMLGAINSGHWGNGFFMNWTDQQAGEGIEYHLLVIGMSISLLISGAGRWSIDRKIAA